MEAVTSLPPRLSLYSDRQFVKVIGTQKLRQSSTGYAHLPCKHVYSSRLHRVERRLRREMVVCSGSSKDSFTPPKISSAAKIRNEVMSPFRSVRMFFYLAFSANATIGSLISLPRLIAAVGKAPNAAPITDVFQGLAINLTAIVVCALLYIRESKASDRQLARLSREETLADLKLELSNKKVVALGEMRGVARLVIVAGPASFIEEAYKQSEPYISKLLERGVLVVSYATDGLVPQMQFSASEATKLEESEDSKHLNSKKMAEAKKLWRATSIYTSEWARWLKQQKQFANVPDDRPVYLSLRMDGRVRGSAVGLPPWNAFVVQLPPLKGIWSGALDGMDGRI